MATEPHKHCPTCGTPIPMNEQFCSPRCEQIVAENQRKVRRARIMLYAVLVLFLIVLIYFTFRGKLF